jgi:hypothetical protein
MDVEAAIFAQWRPVEGEPVKGEPYSLKQHGQYQTGEEYEKVSGCHAICFRGDFVTSAATRPKSFAVRWHPGEK